MVCWLQKYFSNLSNPHKHNVIILRHGQRQEINPGFFGENLELTPEGRKAAKMFGSLLASIPLGEVHTSPILRCIQTAEALLQGAKQDLKFILSKVLGDPGPFIVDAFKAGPLFLEKPLEQIAQLIVHEQANLPGIRSIGDGAAIFLNYVLSVKHFPCFMITHDIVICLLCCYFFESYEVQKYLPGFLEGFLLEISSNKISIFFRDEMKILHLKESNMS